MRALPQVCPCAVAFLLFGALATALAEGPALMEPVFTAEQVEIFEQEIRPLLIEHCHKCHSDREEKGNLRLDSRAALLKGGDTGPAIVPGKPDESLLIDAVSYGDLYQMPPTGKLAERQIAALRRWVEAGAPWSLDTRPSEPLGPIATRIKADPKTTFDLAERAKHWAFQPLAESAVPAVKDPGWPQSTDDSYVLSRLEAEHLTPAEPADKATLLRRATFDLVGLPPTPDEIAAFLCDDGPDAFGRVVDRLLASPHFGERWGRHWLDLVRYAESKGHEFDYTIPNAWQYRDYVIRALNADVPYDRFVAEHVAGDLLDVPRRHPQSGFNESPLGTGFWFLGEEVHSPVELRADELDRLDNKIDVFSKTFLALTVACARCHDHKFDAISTKDYYALAGHILSGSYRQAPFDAIDAERKVALQLAALRAEHREQLVQSTHAALRPMLDRVGGMLLATRDVLQAAGTDDSPAMAMARAQAIEAVAAGRQLVPGELAPWVEAVRQAIADASSPLYPWAVVATARGQSTATPAPSAVLQDALRQPPSSATAEARVVIDYGSLPASEWRQDGFAFGLGPVNIGDLSYGGTAERFVTRVWSRAAAVSDPLWNAAALAAGVEREAGRLAWLQSGRMLRTRTFTLTGGKLYYLVSGSGYAYAAVYSHRMNNGPLHAALVREWQAGERFQWIEHDLSDYRGERVHIEFSPRQPGETNADASPVLAIAQVVESEQPPQADTTTTTLALTLADTDLSSPEALAAAYQRRIIQAAEQLASGSLAEPSNALLADWLVRNLPLFVPAESDARRALSLAVQPFIDAQARLAEALPRHIHTAPAMLEGNGVDECVLLRGNPKTPGELVPRRYLEALGGAAEPAIASGSGRAQLARQMTDPARPQVARVIVNRIWHHLFGRGIVASVDNFGVMGDRPTHPDLLDRLARDFMQDGWSIKRLIRRLVLSATYQSSSRPSDAARERDPSNHFFSHATIKRLEAETIRDSILAVSGRLDRRMFGASVPAYLSEFMEGRGRPPSGPLDGDGRRSIYLSVRRNFLSTLFLAFDYPVPFTAVGRRAVSNVPAQALTMMNSPFVAGEARRWAERDRYDPSEPGSRIKHLYLRAFGRLPSEIERSQAAAFLAAQSQRYGSSSADPRAWADLCHVLLNAKPFLFIE